MRNDSRVGTSNKLNYRRKIAQACLMIIFIFGISFFGEIRSFAEEKYQELQIFAKVLNLVQKYYVEPVDPKKLIEGGIKGMLGELDPHTNYLPPDIFKEFQDETSGEFGGIGIEISIQDEVLTIISPIEDTPAWKSGIKAGDKVVSIGGESTKGFTLVEAAQRMKGKDGEIIRLGIMRKGFDKPKIFEIKRGRVKLHTVKQTNLLDGYLYIKITSFIESTSNDFAKIIKNYKSKYGELRGLIIDLRNNPGGLLDQAVKMGEFFISDGVVVSTVGRTEKDKEIIKTKKNDNTLDCPVVILLNEYSASASEIFAGAMRDNDKALIVGQRSFGKGSVQSVVKLGDGSGLKLTVARYYTPKGVEIQARGISPDILIEDMDSEAYRNAILKKPVRREADIKGHLKNSKTSNSLEVKKEMSLRDDFLQSDYQASQAFNYLKAHKVFKK